jgi:hypothetical protein
MMMRKLIVPAFSVLAITAAACGNAGPAESTTDSTATPADKTEVSATVDSPAVNTLTAAEESEGWKLLFNGRNLDGWRIYKNKPADSWTVDSASGTLHCLGSKTDKSDKRADLITNDQYENFEFSADWKLAPQGNSGIIYMVQEDAKASYLSGPEYQLIDDNNFPEKLEDWQKTGANYAMGGPLVAAAKPIGEWNTSRIIVNGNHVEHWLNGQKTAEYELNSPEWKQAKETGKWKGNKEYAAKKKGHICFQDHGSEIWFRNIKVKSL